MTRYGFLAQLEIIQIPAGRNSTGKEGRTVTTQISKGSIAQFHFSVVYLSQQLLVRPELLSLRNTSAYGNTTTYEFERLAAAYDEVNRHIWRVESEDEPTTDEVLEKLKKKRLLLKDDIATLLTKMQRRM
jgi:uncharacterized protein YdcH (DUF465 family)